MTIQINFASSTIICQINVGEIEELVDITDDASFDDLLAGTGNTFGFPATGENSYTRVQEPYTRTRPINPRTGTNSVVEDADPRTNAAAVVNTGDAGWLYNSTTGEFAANGFDETINNWVTVAAP